MFNMHKACQVFFRKNIDGFPRVTYAGMALDKKKQSPQGRMIKTRDALGNPRRLTSLNARLHHFLLVL